MQNHTNTIPILARGFLDSKRYVNRETVTRFLDEHLRARIGTRLIAEQHIALHNESQPSNAAETSTDNSWIGVIDTALRPARIIKECASDVAEICEYKYGVRPSVVLDGEPETQIAHVPVHLSYIVTELLKNAFRATIEKGHERRPIQVTIAPAPADAPEASTTLKVQDQGMPESAPASIKLLEKATSGVTIRFRDEGGGIPAEDFANIWEYSFTTFNEKQGSDGGQGGNGTDGLNVIAQASLGGSSIAGLGYGLPLSRAYAEFFGGGIAVHSMWGWGTDVYLTLRGVGKVE